MVTMIVMGSALVNELATALGAGRELQTAAVLPSKYSWLQLMLFKLQHTWLILLESTVGWTDTSCSRHGVGVRVSSRSLGVRNVNGLKSEWHTLHEKIVTAYDYAAHQRLRLPISKGGATYSYDERLMQCIVCIDRSRFAKQ